MIRVISLWWCVYFLLNATSIHAQSAKNYVPGQLLVRVQDDKYIETILKDVSATLGTRLAKDEQVSKHNHIWLLSFDPSQTSTPQMLEQVRRHPLTSVAQFNHTLQLRNNPTNNVPNDPQYAQQWQYDNVGGSGGVPDADIDAPEAWDITTGGVTPLGDTIVVAVVDEGFSKHPDLVENLWKNHDEVPNNNLDDDNNGYVDDYEGYSSSCNCDDVFIGGSHGTPVAGIVGARGNNALGVSGVNWHVKVMPIRGGTGVESEVIESYGYALEARKRFNQTQGQRGAFVVATNSSWGTDFADAADYPLWCAFYDTLGVYGILSAGATTNSNTNVDVMGDMPTSCSSEYLITVTNMRRNDTKVTGAGYGANTIDIGAFGEGTWTLTQSNYGQFGGTSGATPHVAGAIALLYAAPCPTLTVLAKNAPHEAARMVRDAILQGGDINTSLIGITTTGKRLNIKNALDSIITHCSTNTCIQPYSLSVGATDVQASLAWQALPSATSFTLHWRPVGALTWVMVPNATSPYTLSNLVPCTDYEFQVLATCGGSVTSDPSTTYTFKTDGCCLPPTQLTATSPTENTLSVSWQSVLAAQSYEIHLRKAGQTTWSVFDGLTTTSTTLNALEACTTYELKIRTHCISGDITDFTPTIFVRTIGCGLCGEGIYCTVSFDASYEHIEQFNLSNIANTSGMNTGYGNFTDQTITLQLGVDYPFTIVPGGAVAANYSYYYYIFADINKDGDFDDSNERLFETLTPVNGTQTGTIQIPATTTEGTSRLRIVMRYSQFAETQCSNNGNYGEAEDYCLSISPFTGTHTIPSAIPDIRITPNPTRSTCTLSVANQSALYGQAAQLTILNTLGQPVQQISIPNLSDTQTIPLQTLQNGMYLLHISTQAGQTASQRILKQ
jgi:serine protease